jgi:hypothetical protein
VVLSGGMGMGDGGFVVRSWGVGVWELGGGIY